MFAQVKQEIDNTIKTNGNNEITATRLNGVLQDMMDAAAEEIENVAESVGDQVEANPTGEATTPLTKIKIGETNYNIPQTDTSNLATKQELQQGLSGKQDTIADLEQIRTRADEGHTALQPLSGAQENNFASFDANGDIKDSGCNEDTFIKGVKKGTETLTPVNGVVTIPSDIESAHATSVSSNQSATATIDSNHVLQLEIPRGADAVNPFKGWYDADITGEAGSKVVDDTANLPVSPTVGDYAYVKTLDITGVAPSQTETPVVKIYECTTAGSWSNSGRTADTSNVQTFASGEEVNEVSIINDFTTGGTTNVASAKTVKELNNKKLDNSLNDDTFYIVDNHDKVIAKIDANGIHSTDYSYKDSDDVLADEQGNVSLIAKLTALLQGINSEATTRAEAVGTLSSSKLDAEFDGSSFYFTDSEGYIICKIDADGVHAPNIGESTAVDKYKVACMVLGENYYPSVKPTRDDKGFVTNMTVIFETGVSGTIGLTYDTSDTRKKGNISSISVTYGTDSYTITITRDNSGNINTVSVE